MLSLTSPIKTPYHHLRAGWKLLALGLFTLVLFWWPQVWVQLAAVLAVLGFYALPGWRFMRTGLAMLRPLWIFVVIVMAWHVLTGDITGGLSITLRMVAAFGFANLVTLSTRLDDMIDIAMWVLRPLRWVGVHPGALGLAIAMVIRFTPVLMGIGAHLSDAWRARSTKRPMWRILVPVTLVALDDAEHVAEALRARGGIPRNT